jgi:hypothetical protein
MDQLAEQFLHAAAQQAGLGGLGYPELVAIRLERGRRLFGDRFLKYPLERIAKELGEEGLDLGGWAVGGILGDDFARRAADDPDKRMRIALVLQTIAAHGAHVELLKRQLVDLLEESRR